MNKLGKIAPIIVIVACLGSLYLAFTLGSNKKRLEGENAQLTADLDSTRTQLGKANTDLASTKTALTQKTEDLDKANTDLASTKEALTSKTQEAETLLSKNTELDQQLQATKAQLGKAEEAINTVKETFQLTDISDLSKFSEKMKAQADESKMLGEQLASMRQENVSLKKQVEDLTTTPAGVRGRVSLVENNWGFVVLDIGDAQRVRRNSEFLIYRDSKLIGKVQITSVAANTSVAQILPGYPGGPRPGDQAVH